MNVIAQQAPPLEQRRRQQARARRLVRRVETLVGAGRMEEAIACQSEVTALRPDDPGALLRLGVLYREVRRLDQALGAFRRAAGLSPGQRGPREMLIDTLLEARRYDETIAESKALVKIAPRSIYARDILRVAFLQTGQAAKALQVTSEMIRLDPLNPDHHFKRALLFQDEGNLRVAMGEYERTMDLAAPDSEAFQDALEALQALDDHQLQQIMLLAGEDRLFRWKLQRDAIEAAEDRGFILSAEGLARLRHLAHVHLPDLDDGPAGPVLRVYN